MDLCHLKHSALEKHPRDKIPGRVVRWADNVQDDSGRTAAVFVKQGAPASQLAAATFLDNDAAPAYSQVHMWEAPRPLRPPQKERPQVVDNTAT